MQTTKKISFLLFVFVLFLSLSQPVLASSGKININTATKKELVTLKHIGDKIADRIIEYRSVHPFEKPEDIKMVKGVGDKVYEANKDMIIVKDE